MPSNQGRGFQRNPSFSAYQKPPLQGAYDAPKGPPLTYPHMAQSYLSPGYNKLDKVNKKASDIEKMIRELNESNERMMKTMSEQFA